MQYVDDNMDELFRKAAENYPLKTDNANWNEVEKSLQEQTIATNAAGKKIGRYRRLLWLLLLLPLPFICTRDFNNSNKKATVATTPKQEETAIDNKSKTPVAVAPLESADKLKPAETVTLAEKDKANNSGAFTTTTQQIAKGKNITDANNHDAISANQQPAIKTHDNTQVQQQPLITAAPSASLNKQIQKKAQDSSAVILPAATAKDTAALALSDTAKAKDLKKAKTIIPLKKGFYAGIIGGIDVSTIKLQPVKKTGYSLGVLIGYRFNKNISVESGLLWDKKNYYTEGKYFNKERANIPYNVWIKDMDGYCNMYELPINFRYDVLQRSNNRLFATAGFSTYFMKKENYSYTAQADGNWYSGAHSYKNSTNNWFGILNLSAGYEVRLSNLGNFRVEPYLKVPLKGLGIGSMPILSGGLNIGITRSLK